MDDSLSTLLEIHNSFGFHTNSLEFCLSGHKDPICSPPRSTEVVSTAAVPSPTEVPDFISDQGTPNSTASLTTPTQHPLNAFMFPPEHMYRTLDLVTSQLSFPSEESGWCPSIANPSQTPIPLHLHPLPYQGTWDINPQSYSTNRHTNHPLPTTMPHNNFCGVPALDPTFHAGREGIYHLLLNESDDSAWPRPGRNVQQASDCNPQGNVDGLPKGKTEGIERPREYLAPYRVDNDHDGVEFRNPESKQAFQSKTTGYENDDKAKGTTKRNKRKLPADHHVTGSSVGVKRSLQSRTHYTTLERLEGNKVGPANTKRTELTIIRRHARLKPEERGYTFVNRGNWLK